MPVPLQRLTLPQEKAILQASGCILPLSPDMPSESGLHTDTGAGPGQKQNMPLFLQENYFFQKGD